MNNAESSYEVDMNNEPLSKPSTLFRECLGLFGAFAWFFCSMYSYEETLFDSYFYIPLFLLALFLSMVGFGLYTKNNLPKLSAIAAVLTPFGVICTALMYLLPERWFISAYIASGAFMGPILLRRVYGAVEVGGEKSRFRCYFQAIAFTVVFHSVWAIAPISYAVKFPIIALLAAIAWFGTRRSLPVPEYTKLPKRSKGAAGKNIISVVAAILLLELVDFLFSGIHTYFVLTGFENDLILWFGGTILPAAAFFMYAYLFDKGRERGAFLFGMGLALLGAILALIPNEGLLIVPLMITDGIGETFTEFILVASSVYLYRNSRRPFLAAAGGLAITLVFVAVQWMEGLLLSGLFPPDIDYTNPNLVLQFIGPAAIATLLFIALGLYLMDRQKEKNLVYAILGLKSLPSAIVGEAVPSETDPPYIPDALKTAGFLPEERDVASLLIEGYTKGEIARKLHVTSADVGERMRSIRGKVEGVRELADESLESVAAEYKLTKREAQILRSLFEGKTNVKI